VGEDKSGRGNVGGEEKCGRGRRKEWERQSGRGRKCGRGGKSVAEAQWARETESVGERGKEWATEMSERGRKMKMRIRKRKKNEF